MEFPLKKDILYDRIKNDILAGKLKAGQKLPKGLDFARELGASYITLRRALEELEKNGYIALVHGKGTFVRETKPVKAQKRFLVLHNPHPQDPSWPYHYIVPGIERTAMPMGIDIETCFIRSITDLTYADVTKILEQREISGVIIITNGFIGNEKILDLLRGQGVPVLLTHADREDYHITGLPTITYNVKSAWRETLRHLRDMGHQRIITVAQRNAGKTIRGYAFEEYLDLLKDSGADPSEDLIFFTDYNEEIKDVMSRALSQALPPTAILCFSDFLAPMVYKTLRLSGLRIPEDVAVMGFCGSPDGVYMEPSLSTMDLGYFNIGKTAVELLAESARWFQRDLAPPLVYSDYQLKIRKSTDRKIFEREAEHARISIGKPHPAMSVVRSAGEQSALQ